MPVSSFGNIVNKAKTASSGGVPEGVHNFVVREAPEVDEAKQVIKVRCRVEDGPSENGIVFKTLKFDEGEHEFTLSQAVNFVLGIGISEDEFVNMSGVAELAESIHGSRFSAKVVKQKPKNWKEGDRMFDNFEDMVPADSAGSGPGPQPPQQPQYQQQGPPPGAPQYQQQGAPQGQPQYQQAPPPPQPQQGDPNQQVWQPSTPQDQNQQYGYQPPQGQYQQPVNQNGAPPAPPLL